ncbi:MAG: hypothetical protein HY263_10665 [Chloroflexi bacterium]|nr:hypothetical protein [Chloroflexota bacterium]
MIADYRQLINRDLPLVERGCSSKAAYGTRGEARSLSRRGRHIGGRLAAYRCRWCGLWHLGHAHRAA